MYTDHHPKPWRVNFHLAIMPEFAEAFSCPKGSKLNPEKQVEDICFIYDFN